MAASPAAVVVLLCLWAGNGAGAPPPLPPIQCALVDGVCQPPAFCVKAVVRVDCQHRWVEVGETCHSTTAPSGGADSAGHCRPGWVKVDRFCHPRNLRVKKPERGNCDPGWIEAGGLCHPVHDGSETVRMGGSQSHRRPKWNVTIVFHWWCPFGFTKIDGICRSLPTPPEPPEDATEVPEQQRYTDKSITEREPPHHAAVVVPCPPDSVEISGRCRHIYRPPGQYTGAFASTFDQLPSRPPANIFDRK
ncbi:uncharacterized protein LOC119099386 [Pollicipes pollicipes]|uniref:uncharacterized protein LOC119099386 n=1 Tax=Pollicipes pollicipes TaxID=41117 RepID=UPI0018857A16|nr:uncharacterized protein LOC119099386 [Pollicipes pollicipes]